MTNRIDVVERHGWNIGRAALVLGIAPSSLRIWLSRRGIARPRPGRPGRPLVVQVRSAPEGLEKLCRRCREWWPVDECFHRDPRSAFGRANYCRDCTSLRMSEYRARKEAT